jgi:serine/threonine protein kinase
MSESTSSNPITPAPAQSAKSCPKCGAAIPPEAPQGLCPKCLLQQASFPTEAGAATRHTRPAPPDRDELARAFPHLQILELIGQGGMGFVYKARQPKLDRLVALKVLAQPLAEQTHFAERFTREGRTLAKLNHPNIVTIHDFGQAGPFFYLLMEYVDGVNLRQAMRARAINADQTLAIVPRICEALQYAHNEGVLHRDIKPDNILLDTRGRVKIADFGIAKLMAEAVAENPLTGSGASLGTPHYMAPEQIEKPNAVDHRADIYSLGVVFYEMLTGELPLGRFAAPSEKSAIDPRLDEVVFQTLEKQPERRPQSAREVKTKVETIAAGPQQRSAAPKYRAGLGSAILKGALILLFLFLFGLAIAFGLYVSLRHTSPPISATLTEPNQPTEPSQTSATGRIKTINLAFDYFGPDPSHNINLKAVTDLAADEEVTTVVRYNDNDWSDSRFISTWHSDDNTLRLNWPIPDSFSIPFDLDPVVGRFFNHKPTTAVRISTNAPIALFSVTNALHQKITCGIRYNISSQTNSEPRLLNFTARSVSGGFETYFQPDLPPGTKLVAGANFDGAPEKVRIIRQMPDGTTTISWRYPQSQGGFSNAARFAEFESQLRSFRRDSFFTPFNSNQVTLQTNIAMPVFAITNGYDRVMRGYLAIVPLGVTNLPAARSGSEPASTTSAAKIFEFNSVTNSDNYIVLQSETPIEVGKSLVALVEDSTGKTNRAISGLTVRHTPNETHTTAQLMWKIPDGSPTNSIADTMQKIRETIVAKPIQLSEGESRRLFDLRSVPGSVQQFAAVRYESVASSKTQTTGTVRIRSTFPMRNGLILNFDADVPPGYRLEAESDPSAGDSDVRLDCSNIGGHNYYNAVWMFQDMSPQDSADIRTVVTNTATWLKEETFAIDVGRTNPIYNFRTTSGRQFPLILKLHSPNEHRE